MLRQSLLVNSPLGRLAAGVALNTGDLGRAEELIETAVRPRHQELPRLLLRARLHEAMNQDKEAEDEYRKATEAAPEEPAAWVAYILFLGNHGRETRRPQAIVKSDVAAKVAKDKAALAVAECYEVLAMSDGRRRSLRRRPDGARRTTRPWCGR